MKNLYLIKGSKGQLDEYEEWVECALTLKREANELCNELNDQLDEKCAEIAIEIEKAREEGYLDEFDYDLMEHNGFFIEEAKLLRNKKDYGQLNF